MVAQCRQRKKDCCSVSCFGSNCLQFITPVLTWNWFFSSDLTRCCHKVYIYLAMEKWQPTQKPNCASHFRRKSGTALIGWPTTKAVNLALNTNFVWCLFRTKKNKGKNKLSSTMLLLTLHAKHRKAIYPSSSLRDDKVGHEKTFEIQTTSEDILRRPTQDIVGTLQTPANNFSWTNTLNTIESNQLSLTKKDFGKKRASKKLNFKSQFKYFSWKLQNRTSLLIHRNMKQSRK